MIDTHAHIYDSAFDNDRDEVVGRAVEAGIRKIVTPAIDSESHGALFETARKYPDVCFPMIGLHPTSVNDNPAYRKELKLVADLLRRKPAGITKFYGIGEIGLDFYWSQLFIQEQIEVFKYQLELAVEYDLPVTIHTRSAWDEMIAVLSEFKTRGVRGIMHAFSGTYQQYLSIKECGNFLFGIGGIVTYKNSGLSEIVSRMDIRDIVLETDCPYLTPVPLRGQRNEPSYLKYTSLKTAEILGVSMLELVEFSSANAMAMMGLA